MKAPPPNPPTTTPIARPCSPHWNGFISIVEAKSRFHLIFWEPSHAEVHGRDEGDALAKRANKAESESNPREALGEEILRKKSVVNKDDNLELTNCNHPNKEVILNKNKEVGDDPSYHVEGIVGEGSARCEYETASSN